MSRGRRARHRARRKGAATKGTSDRGALRGAARTQQLAREEHQSCCLQTRAPRVSADAHHTTCQPRALARPAPSAASSLRRPASASNRPSPCPPTHHTLCLSKDPGPLGLKLRREHEAAFRVLHMRATGGALHTPRHQETSKRAAEEDLRRGARGQVRTSVGRPVHQACRAQARRARRAKARSQYRHARQFCLMESCRGVVTRIEETRVAGLEEPRTQAGCWRASLPAEARRKQAC
jgi:hypothetical protein